MTTSHTYAQSIKTAHKDHACLHHHISCLLCWPPRSATAWPKTAANIALLPNCCKGTLCRHPQKAYHEPPKTAVTYATYTFETALAVHCSRAKRLSKHKAIRPCQATNKDHQHCNNWHTSSRKAVCNRSRRPPSKPAQLLPKTDSHADTPAVKQQPPHRR